MMAEKTVIYIAGYGRSGSTLLARILGSHENIFAVGELINFLKLIDSEESVCSCGKKIQRCEFWSDIIQKFGKDFDNISELKDIQKRYESFSCFFRRIFERGSYRRARYADLTQYLISSIFQNLPNDVRYIIDSSKTTWSRFFRPISFAKIGSLNVKVIHIIRDGRGCIWSNIKGADTGLLKGADLNRQVSFPVFRTAAHWLFANMGAHVFQAINPSKDYCWIRYEDLIERPEETYVKLGEFLGVCFDQQIEMIRTSGDIPPGHLIAGNRMRSFKKIRIKADVEWKKRLRLHQQLLFWFFGWPLALFYNYRLTHHNRP
jgi:hypothetical protein